MGYTCKQKRVSQNCQVDLKGEKKTNENNIGDLWRFYITILDTWLDTGYWIPMWFGQEDIKTLGATTGSLKFPSQFKRNTFSTLLCNLLNNSTEVSNNRLFELLVRGKYFYVKFQFVWRKVYTTSKWNSPSPLINFKISLPCQSATELLYKLLKTVQVEWCEISCHKIKNLHVLMDNKADVNSLGRNTSDT